MYVFLYNLFYFQRKVCFSVCYMFQDLHKLELSILQKHTEEVEKQEKEKKLAKLREKVTYFIFFV